ncbi:MAG: hypothetical protein FWF06_03055 [Symbiobacteriaceae bacterium]|nr:hypothetical protein [Symbiobacteriaceae bacterium]
MDLERAQSPVTPGAALARTALVAFAIGSYFYYGFQVALVRETSWELLAPIAVYLLMFSWILSGAFTVAYGRYWRQKLLEAMNSGVALSFVSYYWGGAILNALLGLTVSLALPFFSIFGQTDIILLYLLEGSLQAFLWVAYNTVLTCLVEQRSYLNISVVLSIGLPLIAAHTLTLLGTFPFLLSTLAGMSSSFILVAITQIVLLRGHFQELQHRLGYMITRSTLGHYAYPAGVARAEAHQALHQELQNSALQLPDTLADPTTPALEEPEEGVMTLLENPVPDFLSQEEGEAEHLPESWELTEIVSAFSEVDLTATTPLAPQETTSSDVESCDKVSAKTAPTKPLLSEGLSSNWQLLAYPAVLGLILWRGRHYWLRRRNQPRR